ncbi:MAG: PAS domain-containing sensor histidine kinase [Burkholderiaceae bacterium]
MPPSKSPRWFPRKSVEGIKRLAMRWWRRQSPSRQDRYVILGPLISVLLFLTVISTTFWFLRAEELTHEEEAVARAGEMAQQQMRLRLLDHQEQLIRLAREISTRDIGRGGFVEQAQTLTGDRPEITRMLWLGPTGQIRLPFDPYPISGDPLAGAESESDAPPMLPGSPSVQAFLEVQTRRQPAYSSDYWDDHGRTVVRMVVPLLARGEFIGALAAQVDLERLLRHSVADDLMRRHTLSIMGSDEQVVATTGDLTGAANNLRAGRVHEVPLNPLGPGLFLRTQGWRTSSNLIGNVLFWMVVGLSALTVWMLLGSLTHLRRRNQMQATLMQETNFRRAMENSILTGMRAMDLQGRITHVNRAFCEMTGYSSEELIGREPPYPYWLPDRIDETMQFLQQELMGRTPSGGIEVKVRRKDGEVFDARMYVSPLVDHRGEQTGWMTSMTNITEAKRVRDQLTASHERFTTVLEGLDAAVSVVSMRSGELLFANRSYRVWFGSSPRGHLLLSEGSAPEASWLLGQADERDGGGEDPLQGLPTESLTAAGTDPQEVQVESLQKWFDVRSRYLQWTDGRLAQMIIATDITARRRAEEATAQQAEKAQVTSRLVTMGEMASSVAHELNQPLTAINNYCHGMVNRVRESAIDKEDLIAALEKTARQAERAGQIIHRIRAFVKRSEPQRQAADARSIIDDAVELANIDLRRRKVQLNTYVAQRMPALYCDPILIEQVVLNLVKNAAEAIDIADMPPSRRRIELRVVPRQTEDGESVVEFSITDTGPGMAREVLDRIYEAFFSTKREGLGIGLSLCRSIIESHRGRLAAENLYNGELVSGCRFTFTLPVDTTMRLDALPDGEAARRPEASTSA